MAIQSGNEYIRMEQLHLEENVSREAQVSRITEKLKDGYRFHPYLQATLEAVYIKGAPLPTSDSLEVAAALSQGLMELDEHLKTSDKPLPVAVVTHQSKLHENYIPYNELQIDYGLSTPNEGLRILKTPDGAPHIGLPVSKDSQPTALATPSWNSHYASSEPRARAVIVNKNGNKQRSKRYPKPMAGDFVLPLPAGSLNSRFNRPWPYLAWDNHSGSRDIVDAPKDFLGRPDVVAFIGRRSVKAGLQALYGHMKDVQQGRVPYNNDQQPKYDPKVVKAMYRNVLSGLEKLEQAAQEYSSSTL